MSEKSPYQIPGFLNQALNNGEPFSEKDEKAILDILAAADHFSYPEANTQRNWDVLRSRIESPMTVTKKPAKQFSIYKWAAAAVVVLGLSIGIWQYNQAGGKDFTANYKTQGTPTTISLPDKTTIQLNANSELQVTCINDQQREVKLVSGEAYFSVTHNDLPFTVSTDKGTVQVMGTEFNIRNIPNTPFSVALKSGKVRFQSAAGQVDLKPGECVKEDIKGAFIVSTISIDKQFPFRDDKLVFDAVPLSEIIKELEARYNVKFVYERKLESEKVTITFKENMNAKEAAELLSATLGSKVTIE